MTDHTRVRTTTLQPHYLAHLALEHRLHNGGILKPTLYQILQEKPHHIAMTFLGQSPACVAVLASYGQLMVYTPLRYRNRGFGKRTARVLSRQCGISFSEMVGGIGVKPQQSRRYFESLGVPLCRDYDRED